MYITEISSAIFEGWSFRVCSITGYYKPEPIGFFNQFFESSDSKRQRLEQIAEVFTSHLNNLPRGIPQGLKDRDVRAAKLFLERVPQPLQQEAGIQKLQQAFLACKLGVTPENLSHTPGFAEWCMKSHLYNYLKKYHHKLQIGSDGEIQIKVKEHHGDYSSWSSIDSSLKEIPSPELFKWPWLYGEEGLQREDFFSWSKMRPYKKSDPGKWGKRNVVQICTTAARSGKVRTIGDHTYEKYLTENGEKYSCGYYRQDKKFCQDTIWTHPLRVKQMDQQSPDVSIFWDDPEWYTHEEGSPRIEHKISIAVTAEQLKTLMAWREREKEGQRKAIQILPKNCDYLIMNGLRKIGIQLPTDAYIWSLYLPKPIRKASHLVYDNLPETAQKVVYYGLVFLTLPAVFLLNCIQFFLGASQTDPKLKDLPFDEKNERVLPTLQTFWDLFDHRKLIIYSPVRLLEVIEEVNEWRAKESYRLQGELEKLRLSNASAEAIIHLKKKISDIRYSLPPSEKYHCALTC
jgi:hypothetical protein